MERRIKITVSKNGEKRTIEAIGFEGPSCENTIKRLATRMGGETIEETHKPEFFQTEEVREDLKEGS